MPGRRDCSLTGYGRIHHRSEHHEPRPAWPAGRVVWLRMAPQSAGAVAAPAACRRSARFPVVFRSGTACGGWTAYAGCAGAAGAAWACAELADGTCSSSFPIRTSPVFTRC